MVVRVAVVTGASSGIGAELSRLLCRDGWRVVGFGRSRGRLAGLAGELGGCFSYRVVDLVDPGSLDVVVDSVRGFGGVGLLVNNAGFGVAGPLLGHSPRVVEEVFLVDVVRPLQLVLRLLPFMGRGSVVVNVVSAGVFVRLRSLPCYGAAKAALAYASALLREELAERGVGLVEVYPGPVRTRFFERAGMRTPRWSVDPGRVARAIYRAVKRGGGVVYVPWFLRFLRFLPWPAPIYF